ncbi:hypothetical protein DIPPA_30248 [Diplonema papillatum]|nr:hypothetical protein DIPPA_30248 [Diplonema papillatum]
MEAQSSGEQSQEADASDQTHSPEKADSPHAPVQAEADCKSRHDRGTSGTHVQNARSEFHLQTLPGTVGHSPTHSPRDLRSQGRGELQPHVPKSSFQKQGLVGFSGQSANVHSFGCVARAHVTGSSLQTQVAKLSDQRQAASGSSGQVCFLQDFSVAN